MADEMMITNYSNDQLNMLPPECSAQIFSYLELKDTLNFAATSLSSLKSALPDLVRRCSRMKQRFAYCRDWKHSKSQEGTKRGMVTLWDERKISTPNLVPMPTVEERLDQLQQQISTKHPLYEMVKKLRDELHSFCVDESFTVTPLKFSELFIRMKAILFPLRLHSIILHQAMRSNPMAGEKEASLDQYMGDVLALTYLINSSELGVVEGGPTSASRIKELRRYKSSAPCYGTWVYLHSSILRTKKFTPDQYRRLGLPQDFGQANFGEVLETDCYINNQLLSSEMCLAFYEFGPLVPAFQGRLEDIVHVRGLSAIFLFALFLADDDHHHRGETTAGQAVEWLCLVHEELRKNRPIGVMPPKLRLRLLSS